MRWPLRSLLCGVVLLGLAPAAAQAQSSTAPSQPPAADTAPADPGNFWFGVGGAYVVRRGDCTTCEQDFPFLNDMGLLIDIGRRINPQMDVAAEVYWTPTSSSDDRANVTHLDADRPGTGCGSRTASSSRAAPAWRWSATGST